MQLSFLLKNIEILKKNKGILDEANIEDIVYDSRKLVKKCVFVCLKGSVCDGHDFIKMAQEFEACLIIGEKDLDIDNYIQVENSRKTLAIISSIFFESPDKFLNIIAITGTKGKTITASLTAACLNLAGYKCAVIGTLGVTLIDGLIETKNTTPESYEIHKIFRKLVNIGYSHVVIEASSIGLKDFRLFGIKFYITLFTNFSNDHIGGVEHKNLEEYFNSKLMLFNSNQIIIVNNDDKKSKIIENLYKKNSNEFITYGIHSGEIKAENIEFVMEKNRIGIKFLIKKDEFNLGIPGKFSVYNALAVISICKIIGIDIKIVKETLKTFKVNGRAEVILTNDYTVLIDYAHNGFSMENILTSLREHKPNRLITIFGAGGNRSRDRRFLMGKISGKFSDLSILTADNSRNENVNDIIKDIEIGIKKTNGSYEIIPDREEAIKYSLSIAKKGDIILLAGKGHEKYQEINGIKYPFDEKKIVETFISSIKPISTNLSKI